MRKFIIYVLLAISIFLIFSVKSYAQMQSVINTSTHRTITIPLQGKINPIKSLAVKPSVILSIVKFTPYNITLPIYSIFYLTDDGINTMSGPNYATNFSILYNIETTDIKGGDEEVFFCGKRLSAQIDTTFFVHTTYDDLMGGNSMKMHQLPLFVQKVSKIDFYDDDNGYKKVALIGENTDGLSLFIDVNLTTMYSEVYVSDIPLKDVRHSKSHVVVLGEVSNGKFMLFSHDKNDLHNYIGYVYQTPQLYDLPEHQYLLEILNENESDTAIVGYSAMDQFSGTSISSIDLNSMDVRETQVVDAAKELRLYFKDMKMDYKNNELLCLINNPATGSNDNIFALRPLNDSSYTTYVTIPTGQQGGVDYYKKLVAYKEDPYYMVLGDYDTTSTIHLFDKKQSDFTNLNCMKYLKFSVKIIDPIEMVGDVSYTNVYEIPINTVLINTHPFLTNYIILCH